MAVSKVSNEQESDFHQFGLDSRIVDAVVESGYATATPIQSKTIPALLEGRDVLGQAQTGTGKTAAFALPLIHRLDPSLRQPQVLVLAPTRELAIQVSEAFEKYGSSIKGLKVLAICGGQNYENQFRQLNRAPHVIVGTPGRLIDLVQRGSLNLTELKCVVLDEADEMLRMGFAEDVEWLLSHSPEGRQTALFSATMPESILEIAEKHLKNPVRIVIQQKAATADTVRQRYIIVPPGEKEATLIRIAETESFDAMLVFVKMKSSCEPLAELLASHGFRAAALHGDIAQAQRERIVDRLKSRQLDILIATDVAARGLDVQHISHVVNFEMPFSHEVYVHRIGRTGRAGRQGEAILFVGPYDRRKLKMLEQATRKPLEEMPAPSSRELNLRRIARFHEKIAQSLEHSEVENYKSIIEQFRRQHPEVELEKIAAALALMANGGKSLLDKTKSTKTEFASDRGDRSGRRYGDRGEGRGSYGGRGSFGRRGGFGKERGSRGGSDGPRSEGFRAGKGKPSWKKDDRAPSESEGRRGFGKPSGKDGGKRAGKPAGGRAKNRK